MKRLSFIAALLALAACAFFLMPKRAHSYLVQYSSKSGAPVPVHWDFTAFPVQWSLSTKGAPNVSGGQAAADVIAAAFNTWNSAPNTSVIISEGAGSSASASFDGVNLICFNCSGDFSSDGTLAVTFTTTADAAGASDKHGGKSRFAGQILDADILFNPSVQFTTDGSGSTDLQTVATHEIGHFLGLDHSAVVRAMMFPFAPKMERTLSYDDVAAVSSLYPSATPAFETGTVSGKVMMPDGTPVFGAHVFIDSTTAALPLPSNIRKTPLGAITLPDGSYKIVGVPPDHYTVAAEPLDGPVSNSNIATYAGAFSRPTVQTNFTTRWH